jgi:hypothetical protein
MDDFNEWLSLSLLQRSSHDRWGIRLGDGDVWTPDKDSLIWLSDI